MLQSGIGHFYFYNPNELIMQITGKIIAVLEEKTGISERTRNTWRCGQYVIEIQEEYPKKMFFEVFGDANIDYFAIRKDEVLTVHFNVDAREYNGRWYSQIRAFKVERQTMSNQIPNVAPQAAPSTSFQVPVAPSAEPKTDWGDLPFGNNPEKLPF